MLDDYREVVLSRLRIGLFTTFSSGSTSGFQVKLSRHRRTELDSCRLTPEYTGPIRFDTIMNDYLEVFAAFKGRGRALPASNGSIYNVFKWVKLLVLGQLLVLFLKSAESTIWAMLLY
jgi:hypothetical protein